MKSGIQPQNPRENANIFSIGLFWWLFPLLGKGYKKDLEIEDIYENLKADGSEKLGTELLREWNKELEKQRRLESLGQNYQASLTKALVRQFGPFYALLGIIMFIEECCIRVFQPVLMGWMLNYFSPGSNMQINEALMYAGGLVVCSLLYTIIHHPYYLEVMHVGMRARIAVCSAIFRKVLKLSSKGLGQTTLGQMINLISNDVNRFDQFVLFFHYLWISPLQLIVVTFLLWQKIGISALVGAILLLLFIPLQIWVGKKLTQLRMQTAGKTDNRIRLMDEIINGIKVIKMFTWENLFTEKVEEARKEEIKIIRKTSYFRSFNFSFFFTASRFILLCTFFLFYITGEILTPEKAFLCLSLYNTVRVSMTLFFPSAISLLGVTKVSISRIQTFLLLEEFSVENDRRYLKSTTEVCVEMINFTGKWNKEYTLNDLTLSVKPGQLVAVVGPVGAGKTSLLQSILGELPLFSGQLNVSGDIAYCPQEPWIFAGSIRDNILFGKSYCKEKYENVIYACALEQDMLQWPRADQTHVGEKGVGLSGGQKSRITLARAIYRSATCYLLDDPLSAVDSQVGKHIFNECIKGFLKQSAVILVTHQLQHLKAADKIVVLKEGKVQEIGTYDNLVNFGVDLSAYLSLTKNIETPIDDKIELLTLSDEKTVLNQIHQDGLNKCSPSEDLDYEKNLLQKELKSESVLLKNLQEPALAETHKLISENIKQEIPKELKSVGSVNKDVFLKYFQIGDNWFSTISMLILLILCQVIYSGSDFWISYWTRIEEINQREILMKHQTNGTHFRLDESDETESFFYVGIYSALIGSLIVISMMRTIHFFQTCVKSSVKLHNQMFLSLMGATCQFFDTNPAGRILNRCSKDTGLMDELLPETFFDALSVLFTLIGIMSVIIFLIPWTLLPTLVLATIFLYLRKFYMRSARDIKRIEGISRAPVISQMSTSISGLVSIRAFSAQQLISAEFDRLQDIHSSTWYTFISGTRWFGLWLDWIVLVYLICVILSFFFLQGEVIGGDVGLAITSCIQMTGMLQWGVRQSAEAENLMTSVERILEYSNLPQEKNKPSPEELPIKLWPVQGVIEFKNVCLRYVENEPSILSSISFKTEPCEKIGIVGRSGAGKSSIITALLRLAEPTGNIYIDGLNIMKLRLKDLRSSISIIPQTSLIFSGTLRENLDPLKRKSDADIWRVLEEFQLVEAVKNLGKGLESPISNSDASFSVGQRQLICLARAVFEENRILVLDEATSNIDRTTDKLIQNMIRTRFFNCTVLTIAHRLETIMDSDRVMVIQQGKIVEFASPDILRKNNVGVFSHLAREIGANDAQIKTKD